MRLLVVEDDPSIAESLQQALVGDGYVVDHSGDGASALAAVERASYDCILLDLGLPDMDGTEVLARLRGRTVQVPVVILTARDEKADRIRGLDLGADDYVAKPFELDELEARIRAVTRRSIARRGDAVTVGRLRLASVERRVFNGDEPLDLSPREYAVLECLLMRNGRVISKRLILDAVADGEAGLSESAVEIYVHRVRKKIEGSGCSIQTLRGFGYLCQVDDRA